MKGGCEALLIYGSPEKEPDIYFATGFVATDPVIYLQVSGQKILVLTDLEVERAKSTSRATTILSFQSLAKELNPTSPADVKSWEVMERVLRKYECRKVCVPSTFPHSSARFLEQRGYELILKDCPVFDERLVKSSREIDLIRQTIKASEKVLGEVCDILRSSEIKEDGIFFEKRPITSEWLRRYINVSLMKMDCIATHTIVACGDDSVKPHLEGSGPLRPHQSIVIDIFPKNLYSLYCGDITRTFVVGEPSRRLQEQYNAVLVAQKEAIGMIREGVDPADVHRKVEEIFEGLGFSSGDIEGKKQGFIHGTGHGLGLEIHEPPRIYKNHGELKSGNVVTIEPGLYYFGIGGVRIEDVVVVKEEGCLNLTTFPKSLTL